MKKNIIWTLIILIALITVLLYSHQGKTYKNKKYGFEFNYPAKYTVYAETRSNVHSTDIPYDIVFMSPDIPETEVPLPRVHITKHDAYKFPTKKIGTRIDNYMFGGYTELKDEEIISKTPLIIKYIWIYSDNQALFTDYRVVKTNKDGTVYYFDLDDPDIARSFKFTN